MTINWIRWMGIALECLLAMGVAGVLATPRAPILRKIRNTRCPPFSRLPDLTGLLGTYNINNAPIDLTGPSSNL
jgi:hypothetical protein